MKTTTIRNSYDYRRTPCRYPNCTQRRFTAQRLLDGLLAAAITFAAIVIFLFMFVLF